MDAARYQRLRALVHGAADVPAALRRAWLAAQCPEDPALLAEALGFLGTSGFDTRAVLPVAQAVPAPLVLPPGTRLGQYRVVGEIGRGGMGVVVEAEDEATGGRVAVKVILPHLLAAPGARERFLREARLGLAIAHEHVVRALALGRTRVGGADLDYLVMERVRGRTLRRVLEEMRTVPEALLREIARQAAEGLAALHDVGVVHRDVKPENLVLAEDRRVRLMDLGIAKVAGSTGGLTVEGHFVGSPVYASPEQCLGGEVGPASDLYALGAVLYELAAGRPPFDALDALALLRAHAEIDPVPVAERVPALSDFVGSLIGTLLAKEPASRFPSARALARALEEGEAGTWWGTRPRPSRRSPARRPKAEPGERPVGRERERYALREAWRAARGGEGRVYLLEGEAGIGKSRLVEDLCAEAAEEDATLLRAAFVPAGEATGLGASLARHWSRSLEAEIDRRLGLPAPLAGAFVAWLGRAEVPPPEGALAAGSTDLLLARLLRSLADERPLLWVVEDLHFADAASRRSVVALARAASGRRALLLVTTRPNLDAETRAVLSALPGWRHHVLERLTTPAIGALIGQRVAEPGLARRLARVLAARTDGIPFFVLEMLRDLERRGHLLRGADGLLHEGTALDPHGAPRALQDLVRARVASVPAEDRAWLDVAAVEGFEFDPDLLARARGAKRLEVLEALGRLERGNGLVRSGARLARFDHHLLQEVLYADLPAGLRAALHDQLATVLEAAGPLSGEALVRAASHRLRGGDAAGARPLVQAALGHLRQAGRGTEQVSLALAALALPGIYGEAERAHVLVETARAALLLGRRNEAQALLDEAEPLATAAGDAACLARLDLQRGFERLRGGAFEEAVACGRSAGRRAEALGDAAARVEALGVEGKALRCLGRPVEARACHERGVALAASLPDRLPGARAEADLALVLQEMGDLEGAEAHQRSSLAVLESTGDIRSSVGARSDLANTVTARGRLSESLEVYLEVVGAAQRLGWTELEAVAWVNTGEARVRTGDLVGALKALSTSLDLAKETGDRRVEGYALHGLGLVAAWSGDRVRARRLWEEAERLRRAIDNRAALAETLQQLGGLEVEEGAHERAAALYREAAALAEDAHDPSAAALALLHQAALPGGDVHAARLAFEAAEPRLRLDARLEGRWLLWRLGRSPADLAAAHRVLEEQQGLLAPAARAAFREHVPYARELTSAVAT